MNNLLSFDIIVIGGGATGLGVAVEAISRGYKTLLLEAHDYGSGTSSKSTKLVHGGIRYLTNFDFALVKEGLEERFYFLNNAPHLAHKQSFLIPFNSYFERAKYWAGISLYDSLAGRFNLGTSRFLDKSETLQVAPDLVDDKISGGAVYYDGQFDDTRMLISLLKTFENLGGIAYNYTKVTNFIEENGKISGVATLNSLTKHAINYYAPCIINATGTLSDTLIDQANHLHSNTNKSSNLVTAAQGTHLVFERSIFNSQHAILIPSSDDRVLFVLPWHDKIIVGTTDIPVKHPTLDPQANSTEIEFILTNLNKIIKRPVTRDDIKAIFCGQRPLVKSSEHNTAKISRKHEIFCTANGLITIVGGKWTIYRKMGEDTINFAEQKLAWKSTPSISRSLKLFGYTSEQKPYPLGIYGNEVDKIIAIQHELNNFAKLDPNLPYYQAEIIYHVRHEQALTVEDVLARRTRAVFLDQMAAVNCVEVVAKLIAQELAYDQIWIDQQVAQFKQKFTLLKQH